MSDSQEDPWAWMTPEKAKRLSTFGKLDGTMETAKDILRKYDVVIIGKNPKLEAAIKEIAWEASWRRFRQEEYGKVPTGPRQIHLYEITIPGN